MMKKDRKRTNPAETVTKKTMDTETDRNDATYDEEKADAKDTDGALQKAEQNADSIDPVSEWTTDTVNLRASGRMLQRQENTTPMLTISSIILTT